ncbi:MAG: AraC family transcriptional regulator, partial [Lachnospiraceae bacterium]|nr:AraC family transcriptional regulator [Lachnospiraceae bacterium]
IDRVVEYVQENYRSVFCVKDLADYVHVSESYLSRLMSSHIGMPPMKYVNSVRMENAKRALKTDMPIEQIAALVGIVDQKYFSTVFKRETGLTPSAYRKTVNNM